MTGYQSKKLMADMRFENEDPNMFYNLRHLKQFQERTNSDKTKWFCSWDNENILIYDNKNNIICKLDDIVLAEYIISLHNMSIRLIKEVEQKYE
jgi:hypothetical protein